MGANEQAARGVAPDPAEGAPGPLVLDLVLVLDLDSPARTSAPKGIEDERGTDGFPQTPGARLLNC